MEKIKKMSFVGTINTNSWKMLTNFQTFFEDLLSFNRINEHQYVIGKKNHKSPNPGFPRGLVIESALTVERGKD